MDDPAILYGLVAAALVGLVAVGLIIARERREAREPPESEFGVSTEGMKVCPRCGRASLWTGDRCMYCGTRLR